MSEVFISYSWENEEHNNWVVKLAAILIHNGIKTLIDRFEIFPGSNLEKFMKNGITKSRYVIAVISNGYIDKINKIGSGVSKEIQLMNDYLDKEMIIPILKSNTDGRLPDLFDGLYYMNFDKERFEPAIIELLGQISGQVSKLKPIMGKNIFENDDAHRWIIETEIKKCTYVSPVLEGVVNFNYSNNNGLFTIGSGDYSFDTKWSKASRMSIHVYSDGQNIDCIGIIKYSEIEVNNYKDVDFTSRVRTLNRGDVAVWLNKKGYVALTRVLDIKDDTRGDEEDELKFEYRIKYTYD